MNGKGYVEGKKITEEPSVEQLRKNNAIFPGTNRLNQSHKQLQKERGRFQNEDSAVLLKLCNANSAKIKYYPGFKSFMTAYAINGIVSYCFEGNCVRRIC